MKHTRLSKILLCLAIFIFITIALTACNFNNDNNNSNNNNFENSINKNEFEQEELQIKATIKTSFYMISPNYIENTISFTNVLDKEAKIKITYSFNNGVESTDIVIVEAQSPFTKTYTGMSAASFSIKIISLK